MLESPTCVLWNMGPLWHLLVMSSRATGADLNVAGVGLCAGWVCAQLRASHSKLLEVEM